MESYLFDTSALDALILSPRCVAAPAGSWYDTHAFYLRSYRVSKRPAQSITEKLPIPVEMIERRIFVIRGHKVMLDADLAELYGVTTGNLNLAVRRSQKRFPPDFMFQLMPAENKSLLLQFARAKKGRGGRQTPPYAFTQEGVAMLSGVLNSERAVQVNIAIMRAFVKLRELMATHKELAKIIEEVQRQTRTHSKYIKRIFAILNQLLNPPTTHAIGFVIEKPEEEEPEA